MRHARLDLGAWWQASAWTGQELMKSEDIKAWLRRRINVARAESGMTWKDVAEQLSGADQKVTASGLMSKQSRGSFTAVELVAVLIAVGVQRIVLPQPEAEARADTQQRKGD